MMRFPLLLLGLWLLAAPACAQDIEQKEILTSQAISELSLDDLFARLPENAGKRPGRMIEAEILRRFEQSGSATTDLLMSWARKAISDKAYPLALDVLDQVVILQPTYAEAWNKRATVHYLMDDYSSSMADVRQVLAYEPRHFGALSGLGIMLEAMDRKTEALDVFRKALEIDPQLEKVREAVERLEKETAGQEI